jgi:hypothetical protein
MKLSKRQKQELALRVFAVIVGLASIWWVIVVT